MSLRKIAGLLAAGGLMVGIVGSGVGAQFTASVTAQENIQVGTFGCIISAATPGAVIAGDGSWVTYQAPNILSSAPGSAPFSFTVKANGTIAAKLHVTSAVTGGAAFSSMLVNPVGDVVLNAGDTQAFTAGLKWTELWNPDLNTTASVTYTVSCTDATTFTTFGPAIVTENPTGTYTIVSTLGTDAQCAPYASGCTTWGGIDLTNKNSGKLIGNVTFSFTSSGKSGGGAPRFSLPISVDGTSTIAFYAFLDPVSCGAAPNATFTVSTSVATCVVNTNSGSYGPYANWAAFVAAHPTYQIAPGAIPFIVADGAVGTYIVSAISE
jgi:hypothetical protein